MYKRDHKVRQGNDRFEGFAVDLIQEVATMLKFDYEIYLVHDGNFGSKRSDGSWNGMIGELLQGVSQMHIIKIKIYTFCISLIMFNECNKSYSINLFHIP